MPIFFRCRGLTGPASSFLSFDVLFREPDAGQRIGPVGGHRTDLCPDAHDGGYSPEVIQAAYRIGDSTTNIITPMMSYFGLILAFASGTTKNWDENSLIATMIPYSIAYLVGWVILFYGWVFVSTYPSAPELPPSTRSPGIDPGRDSLYAQTVPVPEGPGDRTPIDQFIEDNLINPHFGPEFGNHPEGVPSR